MTQTILYYPTIDIQDGEWLRNAILYWDKVASIVPYKKYNDLSPELKYLKRCGVYMPIYPINLFKSEYKEDFEKTIISKLKNYQIKKIRFALRRNYKINSENLGDIKIHHKKIYAPGLLELLHPNKVPNNLYKYLVKNNFIEEINGSEWVYTTNEFAKMYIRILAEYLIKISNEDIVVGVEREDCRKDLYNNTWREQRNCSLKLNIKECLPLPAPNTAIDDLLLFKEKYKEDYFVFKRKILFLEKELLNCKNETEYKLLIEDFKVQWKIELAKNKSLFESSGIMWVLGSITSFIGILGNYDTIGKFITDSKYKTFLALGFGAIELYKEYINYKSKVQKNRSSAGYAYLIKAGKFSIIR